MVGSWSRIPWHRVIVKDVLHWSRDGGRKVCRNVWNNSLSSVKGARPRLYHSAAEGHSVGATTSRGAHIEIQGQSYDTDNVTNITPSIINKLDRKLHLNETHPIGILRKKIENHLSLYKPITNNSPIVTPKENFDDLGFPLDHPGRSASDSYYINSNSMLRTHTSAHQLKAFQERCHAFLISADVYRRDEIDASHYPVFHQMEGARTWRRHDLHRIREETNDLEMAVSASEVKCLDSSTVTQGVSSGNYVQEDHSLEEATILSRHLKATVNSLILALFGKSGLVSREPLQIRWIDAYFPFTSPSFEVEVFYQGKWLEILGSGVIQQAILRRAGEDAQDRIGWAFGFGLERIAMVLFGIPDIRLFWTLDERFMSQFAKGEIVPFRPYSKHPACWKDLSFWLPAATSSRPWHEHNFNDLVRDTAGDLVEDVKLVDDFVQPKTGQRSLCFRILYRSMDRNLTNDEINRLQEEIRSTSAKELGVELRTSR